MNREKAERYLKISLFGAILTLIGAAKFPDGANMIEGLFCHCTGYARMASEPGRHDRLCEDLSGISGSDDDLPADPEKMPRGAKFYKFAMYVYLAAGGGAVNLPCGTFMWIYKSVAQAAGPQIGHDIAMRYLLYFLLPAAAVFGVFFLGASMVQFIAFFKGRTPFSKWYCVFNLLIGKGMFNAVRKLGNTALFNGIGTSNMSLGEIVMFTALLIGWKKYAGDQEYVL